jgi:hypothetical protein
MPAPFLFTVLEFTAFDHIFTEVAVLKISVDIPGLFHFHRISLPPVGL